MKRIEDIAYQILAALGIASLPIPIFEIVQKSNIDIVNFDLGNDVSGVLVVKQAKGVIGINPSDSEQRKRFTVAHEFAHYVLHRQSSELFIDDEPKVYFRDQKSSKGEYYKEIEANTFAAAILMPEHFIKEEINKIDSEYIDEEAIIKMASQFQVSTIAMSFRLANLGLI